MANKHVKRGSASLVVLERETKNTMRYFFTATQITVIKKTDKTKCW